MAYDVDEQEGHVSRTEPVAQIARHDIERAHGRGILRRCQYLGRPDPIARHVILPLRTRVPADTTGTSPL
ncbi:hypothetical protein [Streptomyces cuspidosporus]